MEPVAVARAYLDCFCSGDIDGLAGLLAEDFRFEGPFASFASAAEYVDALRDDPPAACRWSELHVFADGRCVNLIYRFEKPGVSTPMSQLFAIHDGRIRRILLIFDGRAFLPSG